MADILYDTQEAVPEDLREFASAKDGKFAVSVAPLAKLTEFRDNNITVSRDRDNLNTLVGKLKTDIGFDPEKYDEFKTTYEELRTTKQLVDDGKLIKDSSLDDAVSKRTTQMQRDHAAQVDTLNTANKNLLTENEKLKTTVDNMELDSNVGTAALDERSGIRPDAIQAVKREAREVFKRRDGKFVPLDGDGNIIFGSDGVSAMTPLEWIKTKLAASAPYLFKDSSGGGANGGRGGQQQDLSHLPPSERMRIAREQAQGR